MVHNIHQIINKHDLPSMHGNQPVNEFLSQYYSEILKELADSTTTISNDFPTSFYENLKKNILPQIKEQCQLILEILELDHKHQHLVKRERFNVLMKLLEQNGALRILAIKEEAIMVRIRQGNGPFDRKDLFHIPFSQRQYASSQRFSIPGDPCLYLSVYTGIRLFADDMLELSWIESGMPKVFYACLYETQEELFFLHLAKKGSTYLQEYDNAKTDAEKTDRQKAISQYLLTLPLRIACFISIEDKFSKKNVSYYEEYALPQLLMEWIQQSSRFDGLAYQSASSMQEARKHNSFNVAIPIKNIDPIDGYDIRLKKIFKLSRPEKIDILDNIQKGENEINEALKYMKRLEDTIMIYAPSQRHPYRRLLAISYSFFAIFSVLKNENETSLAFPFQQLDTLYHVTMLIRKTIDNVQTAEEWVDLYKFYKGDTVLTSHDYDDILRCFDTVNLAVITLKDTLIPKMINPLAFTEPDYEYIK